MNKENATIIRALNNYGRVPEQYELLDETEKLQQELQRKDNTIENITKYVRTFKTNEITDRELCILNDILLITEEKENIVARLKEKSGK